MKKPLLLVDDDQETADGIRNVLSDEYEVSWAKTTYHAIRLAKTNVFWGCLIDVYLHAGDDDGIALAKDMRMLNSETKLFVYSAFDIGNELRDRLSSIEAVFVTKPISGQRLKQVLSGN